MKAAKRQAETEKELALDMEIFSPKENPMFPPWMTERTKFLRYSKAVPCAACGKKSKRHWTMTCQFRAQTAAGIYAFKPSELLQPMTPVCSDHPLAPEVVTKEAKPRAKRK